MTDRELLQRYIRENSREAMCELMRRHIAMVHSVALREVRDPHVADDVTQAVFLVLMRRAKDLSSSVLLSGWLFKVTRYAATDARKQQARRERHEREAAAMRTDHPETTDATWRDIEPHINEAIARLGASDRNVIILRYLEGQSVTDLAQSLGASEEAIRQRLSRALRRLRKHLLRKQVIATIGVLGALLLEQSTSQAAPQALTPTIATTITGGMVSSGSSQAIAAGVLKMMFKAKLTLMAGVAGAVITSVVCAYLIGSAVRADENALPKPVPATNVALFPDAPVPVKPRFAPGATPKATVIAAYQAALAGDETDFLSCFDKLTDAQTATLHNVVQSMHALNSLQQAVAAKFGAPAAETLKQTMGLGVAPADIDNSKEQIDGVTAFVDLNGAGPGKVQMVKVGDVWKISPVTLATLNSASVSQMAKTIPAIDAVTKSIQAGKYATIADAQREIMNAMGGER